MGEEELVKYDKYISYSGRLSECTC